MPIPKARAQTIRKAIIALLEDEQLGARDISQRLGISEKEVYLHLNHTARSLAAQGKRLVVIPSECITCSYVFRDRTRFTRPGKCPKCRKSHIRPPMYRVE
jgi:predicted Zn-ribbon and HTH transcriptional regulator